jgi:hypothetical protein
MDKYDTWSKNLLVYLDAFKNISSIYCYGEFWSFFENPNLIQLWIELDLNLVSNRMTRLDVVLILD